MLRIGSLSLGEQINKLLRQTFRNRYSDRFIYSLIPQSRKHLWLISPPKSGSTWLSAILQNYLGWPNCPLTKSYDRREQEPSLRALAQSAPFEKLFSEHQHTRASKPTIDMIRKARIMPIIQTRDIPDSIISLRDHFCHESTVCPMAYMDNQRWAQLDSATKLQFLIDMAAPWYFNFYAGWFSSDLVRNKIAFVSSYENLKRDPCGELKSLCDHFGLPFHEREAQTAIELTVTQNTRLNQGVVGRGSQLSSDQRTSLKRMRDYYADIDFSSVGFPNEAMTTARAA